MPPAIDMDYCLIVIEKLINPLTPMEQIMPLLRDLMDSVPHPEMKKLAQRIVDPELDQGEKRKLMNEFKNYDHGGENDFSAVNYNELIDKFLDPDLPDHEYKPTMKALLEGDLDQDRKNQVVNIINCHDKEQKANMVKRFKSSFEKDKEEKEKAEAEKAAEILARQKRAAEKAAELKINLLEFSDDGMTLIMRMLDKKIPREKKTEIYDRLMEPDVDAEIKNLAIQMISLTKNTERNQYVEDFKKRREDERLAEEKRKKEEEQRKIEEENARKEEKMRRKNELLARKNKDERMKKRELMIKMRADERRRENPETGFVGPSSVQEREEQRRKERERVKEEMKRFKEKAMKDMKKAEREDMRRDGWMVLPCDGNLNFEVKVLVSDLNSNLSEAEKEGFEKALVKMRERLADIKPSKDVSVDRRNSQDSSKSTETTTPNSTTPVATDTTDPEFEKFFDIFSNPSLTEKEEMSHIKKLITENKSSLVKKLVIKLDSVPGAGKSVIFKALAKKFVKNTLPPQAQPASSGGSKEPKGDIRKSTEVASKEISEESKKSDGDSKKLVDEKPVVEATKQAESTKPSEATKPPSVDRKKSTEENCSVPSSNNIETESDRSPPTADIGQTSKDVKVSEKALDTNNKKRNLSGESNSDDKVKKVKSNEEDEEKENRKRKRSGDDSESGEKKKKKKKHKHKDDKDREKSKKDKHREKDKETKEESKTEEMDMVKSKVNQMDDDPSETIEEVEKPSKPVLLMTIDEVRTEYKLIKVDSYVKVKNLRKLYKAFKKQEEIRNKKWEEKLKQEKEDLEEKERLELEMNKKSISSNGKDEHSKSKSRSNSPQRSRSNSSKPKSRSPSSSAVKNKSKSPARPRSNSGKLKSRSPSRSASLQKSRPLSALNSRSPTRSRSNSKARSPSKSIPLRSRSPSKSSVRSKSRSRSASRARSRSKSDFSMSQSRSPSRSVSVSKSRSVSRSRSRSKSKTISR